MPAAVAIPAIAAVGGALISANATGKAASGAANAAKDANALQWNMFQQNRNDQSPWRTTGQAALGQLGNLFGIQQQGEANFDQDKYLQGNPEASQRMFYTGQSAYEDFMSHMGSDPNASSYFKTPQGSGEFNRNFSMADYQADPGYQFRLEQGAKALERAGAAKGMTLSGAQMKGLTDYNSGMASQEYGNAYNRFMQNRTTRFGELANLAGLGQSSVGQTGQLGAATASNMGNNLTGAANMTGAAGLAGANAWSGALNSLGNTWMQYQQGQQNSNPNPELGRG